MTKATSDVVERTVPPRQDLDNSTKVEPAIAGPEQYDDLVTALRKGGRPEFEARLLLLLEEIACLTS